MAITWCRFVVHRKVRYTYFQFLTYPILRTLRSYLFLYYLCDLGWIRGTIVNVFFYNYSNNFLIKLSSLWKHSKICFFAFITNYNLKIFTNLIRSWKDINDVPILCLWSYQDIQNSLDKSRCYCDFNYYIIFIINGKGSKLILLPGNNIKDIQSLFIYLIRIR